MYKNLLFFYQENTEITDINKQQTVEILDTATTALKIIIHDDLKI